MGRREGGCNWVGGLYEGAGACGQDTHGLADGRAGANDKLVAEEVVGDVEVSGEQVGGETAVELAPGALRRGEGGDGERERDEALEETHSFFFSSFFFL